MNNNITDRNGNLKVSKILDIIDAHRSRYAVAQELAKYITTSNHRAVEEFAAGLKDAMRHLPRHRPTNTSLWDGVQMNVALEAVDAHLASYKAKGDK